MLLDVNSNAFQCATLLGLLTLGSAQAEHQPHNLKAFRTVCLTVDFRIMGKADQAQDQRLGLQMFNLLKAAGLPVATPPCLPKGSTRGGQLNLLFDFSTTTGGGAYLGALHGFVVREGGHVNPTLWTAHAFGAPAGKPSRATLNATSREILTLLMKKFVEDWNATH